MVDKKIYLKYVVKAEVDCFRNSSCCNVLDMTFYQSFEGDLNLLLDFKIYWLLSKGYLIVTLLDQKKFLAILTLMCIDFTIFRQGVSKTPLMTVYYIVPSQILKSKSGSRHCQQGKIGCT